MTRVEDLRGSVIAGLNYRIDDWATSEEDEDAGHTANEKEVDALIAAAHAEGVAEGVEEEKKLKWETYLDLLHGNYLMYLGPAKNLPTVYGDSLPPKEP
jgi:hypothetical protein